MSVLFMFVLILALIAWGGSFVSLKRTVMKEIPDPRSNFGYKTISEEVESNPLMNFPKIGFIGIAGISFLGWLLSISLFFSEAGFQYFIVNPFGKKTVIVTEGYKLVMPLSRVTSWPKQIDIKVVTSNMSEEAIDELEGKLDPINILFGDKVEAKMMPATRFALPSNEEEFITMAVKFRTLENLVYNTLIPTINEVGSNTGYMFTAEDYTSGEAQNMRQTFEEQLRNGSFRVMKEEVKDTTYEDAVAGSALKIKEIRTIYKVTKILDENEQPIQIPNEIALNNIKVSQVLVDNVVLDPVFKERLKAQRDESTNRQLNVQKIKSQKVEQELIIAKGETQKAEKRVTRELEAVDQLVAATAQKEIQAENMLVATILKDKARIDAETVRINSDAKAYAITKEVRAGIKPEVELQMRLDADVAKIKAISGLRLPETMFMGDAKGSDGILSQLIGADIAKSIRSNSGK